MGKVKTNLETAAAKAGMDAKTARKYRPAGASTERIDARTAVADTRGLLSGGREEVQSLREVNPGLESENDL